MDEHKDPSEEPRPEERPADEPELDEDTEDTPLPNIENTVDLVRLVHEGDNGSLDRLFARYYDRVRNIVRRRLGPRLRLHLESGDIIQSAFLRAAQCIGRFEMHNESSFARWLARLVENQINNAADHHFAKKRTAPSEKNDEDEMDVAQLAASTQWDPTASAAAREQAKIVEDCVADLPERYRELIVMRNYLDYSWQEIADETQRPSEDAARMMYAKALSKLTQAVMKRRHDGA